MASKTASKKQRPKRSFILTLALVLIIGSFSITIIDKQLEIREKKKERDRKQQELNQVLENNDRLQRILDNPDKNDYIEQVAREIGFGYPNEKVFYDITPGE